MKTKFILSILLLVSFSFVTLIITNYSIAAEQRNFASQLIRVAEGEETNLEAVVEEPAAEAQEVQAEQPEKVEAAEVKEEQVEGNYPQDPNQLNEENDTSEYNEQEELPEGEVDIEYQEEGNPEGEPEGEPAQESNN